MNEIELGTKNVVYAKKQAEKSEESKVSNKKDSERELVEKVIQDMQDEGKRKEYESVLGEQRVSELTKFYSALNFGDRSSKFEFEIDCPEDKAQRGRIHQFVREKLPYFDSNTNLATKKILINFVRGNQKKQRVPFCVQEFTLMKFGFDTFSALQQISQYFRIPPKSMSTAGIKDKRGVTTQKCTIKTNLSPLEILSRWTKSKTSQFVKLSDARQVGKLLRTGDLYGNRFSIAMRLVQCNKEKLVENVENARLHGFINYYGTQRFGNNTVKTHDVGMELLKLNWKVAFEKILSIDYKDKQISETIANFLQTRDCEACLKKLPFKYRIERQIIDGLRRYGPNSYQQAI